MSAQARWSKKVEQEWDWPPRQYRTHDALEELAPPKTGWAAPPVTKAINIYWWVLKTIFKMFMGAVCAIVIMGALWLIVTILSH